jgi:hypothetical protein
LEKGTETTGKAAVGNAATETMSAGNGSKENTVGRKKQLEKTLNGKERSARVPSSIPGKASAKEKTNAIPEKVSTKEDFVEMKRKNSASPRSHKEKISQDTLPPEKNENRIYTIPIQKNQTRLLLPQITVRLSLTGQQTREYRNTCKKKTLPHKLCKQTPPSPE